MDEREFLRQLTLFQDLTEEQVNELELIICHRTVEAGDVVGPGGVSAHAHHAARRRQHW